MKLHTAICDLIDVEHPVGNAGMAGVAHPELCAAVTEAGGIGTIAMGGASPQEVRERVGAVRNLTSGWFTANYITWYLEDAAPIEAALDAGAPSITLSFGDPGLYADLVHRAGASLITQVQSVAAARRAIEVEADVIIAQGNEAGGHTGTTPLLALLPQVVDAAGDTPVLAAGGIGDGRGLAAALMLGARGAVMGTRFIVADEAVSRWPELPDQVLAASGDDSVWTTAIDVVSGGGRSLWPEGIGARSIRTDWTDRWAGHEQELAQLLTDDVEADHASGVDPTPAYAGVVAGLVQRRESAAEIVRGVVGEAAELLDAAPHDVVRRP